MAASPKHGDETPDPRAVTPEGPRARRRLAWTVAVPVVGALAGALFVTSALSARGTDLRAASGVTSLSTLVTQRSQELDALREQSRRLSREVRDLRRRLADTPEAAGLVRRTRELRRLAGLTPVEGPGLTVTLDDAPDSSFETADVAPFNLVVHQQDIQAVANAMWAGGATAMTIQGQRVVSTTGIRCVGNVVILHGRPFAPPYRITAVGDASAMLARLAASDYVDIYRQYVAAYGLGYETTELPDVRLPGYTGEISASVARPASPAQG